MYMENMMYMYIMMYMYMYIMYMYYPNELELPCLTGERRPLHCITFKDSACAAGLPELCRYHMHVHVHDEVHIQMVVCTMVHNYALH